MNTHDVREQLQDLFRKQPAGSVATVECTRHLSPSVQRLVRRVTRSGRVTSRLDQFILVEASEYLTCAKADEPIDREALVNRVSERLCEAVANRMECQFSGNPNRDTIRQQALETAIA
ncbi:MAG: hypothetical protein CMJ78_10630 [Planctomycetaceae bacterium]|nr:hypothetical protein [Planctomycetaceae bacterium]